MAPLLAKEGPVFEEEPAREWLREWLCEWLCEWFRECVRELGAPAAPSPLPELRII